MATPIRCPKCDTALRVPDEMLSKKVRCKACQEVFVARDSRRDDDDIEEVQRVQTSPRPRPAVSARRRDDDDRPARRDPERRPARDSQLPLILGGVGALLLILGGVAAGIWFFVSSSGTGSVAGPVGPVGGIPGDMPGEMMPRLGGPRLAYRWRGDSPHIYNVKVEVERDTMTELHQGRCFVNAQKAHLNQPPGGGEMSGTGTGFVVHSSGYLVTCHHVVGNATKINVKLGGRNYPGTVVALDEPNDLAVVRINANNLPTLSLGNSDKTQVLQNVIALGFPLSNILGDSIKATRGEINRKPEAGGRRGLQISAPIQPGNSGGPLVTETGLVVGVNNSKLSGEAVNNVGFATPSNDVKRLLLANKLPFETGGWEVKLEGPELVERVSAATALLTVTIGPDRDAEAFRLVCSGSLLRSERAKAGVGPRFGGPPRFGPPMFPQPSTIEMTSSGQVVQQAGGTQLPELLGDMGLFLVEPLSQDNSDEWTMSNQVTISESSGGFGMFGPRFPRGPGGPFGPQGMPDNTKQRQATERSIYKRTAAGEIVTIAKRYELKCDAVAGMDGILLAGDSTITFDAKEGMPRSIEFKGTMTRTSGQTVRRSPITASYKLVEGEEREKALKPPEVKKDDRPKVAAKRPEAKKPADENDLTALLADVKSGDRRRNREAVDRIAAMPVVEARRAEVSKALTGLLPSGEHFFRLSLLKALETWGDDDSVPELIKLFGDRDTFVSNGAIEAVVKRKDERAIEPLAKLLGELRLRRQAAEALRGFGAKAEKAVASFLDSSSEVFSRAEACNVLKDIGTKASAASLKKAAKDQNPFVARAAVEALAASSKRK